MRSLVGAVLSTALVSVASSAFAADLPVKAPYIAAPVAYSWSGCYVGGNLGGKWANNSDTVSISGPTTLAATTAPPSSTAFGSTNSGTVIGGGQIGCNWQAPGSNWVFGIEGDADAQHWSATRTAGPPLAPLFATGDSFSVSSGWESSLRGRIGYAWDRWMLYATGGVGFTGVRTSASWVATTGFTPGGLAVPFPAAFGSDSKTLVGPTAGLGLEYAFSRNWSFGVEGRYTWYGSHSFSAGLVPTICVTGGPCVFAPATDSYKVNTVEVTARLNYKFDWGGPIVARY